MTRANITHVVSVLRLQPADDVFESFQHHCIEVDDVDDENLLEHFPAAVKFIQSGLDAGGGVLVHWLVCPRFICSFRTISYTVSPHVSLGCLLRALYLGSVLNLLSPILCLYNVAAEAVL